MANTILHRGPDAEGLYAAPHIGLAQRRLSIIDLAETANPPLSNEDGTVVVVFNGEIYNFVELRDELKLAGHIFTTQTDTEVLVHLYEQFGPDMVQRLDGMFAFAIWDARQNRLFAARDRLGKKPFNYTRTQHFFAFGSAIRAITALPDVSREPDYAAIDSYLSLRYVPSPATAFKNIRKLPAGHALICEASGSLDVYRYWAPPSASTPPVVRTSEELQDGLSNLIEAAVRKRMVADVPIGALLSGGIDSGLIVAMMSRASSRPVKTFTVGFGDPERDELSAARAVAKRYGTEHTEIIVTPNLDDLLPDLVHHYNEPFADSSAVPTYHVCNSARSEVTVALSGDGGDESFSGYDRYGQVEAWGRVDLVPGFIRQPIAKLGRAIVHSAPRSNIANRVDRGFAMAAGDLRSRYELTMALLKPQEKQDWYSRDFRAHLTQPGFLEGAEWQPGTDTLNWMGRHDQQNYLPDCLMVKMDVASMANGLEVRAPLLDQELVEFAATIPGNLKRRGGTGKLPLRELAATLLPDDVVNRPKTGFDMPVAQWLRTTLRDALAGYLLDEVSQRRGLFNRAAIARIVSEHLDGRRDWSNRLWALLMLEIWFREFID